MKFIRFSFYVWLFLLCAPALAQNQTATPIDPHCAQLAEKHYQQGLSFWDRDWRKKAVEEWTAALKLNPQHEGATKKLDEAKHPISLVEESYQKGLSFYKSSQLDDAQSQWSNALKIDPTFAKAKTAMAMLAEEKYQEDRNVPFDELVQSSYEEAMKLFRQEKYPEALVKLKEAAKMGPNQPQVNLLLKRCQGKIDAKENVDSILEHTAKAREAQAKALTETALAEWDEVLKLDPDDKEARNAKEVLSSAVLQENAGRIKALLAKARQLGDQGDWVGAKKCYEDVLALNPADQEAQEGLAQAKTKLEAKSATIEIASLLKQAQEAFDQKDFRQAKKFYQQVLDLDPKQAEALAGMDRLSDEENPMSSDAFKNEHYNNGIGLYTSTNYTEALKEFRAVPDNDPAFEQAQKHIKSIKAIMEGPKEGAHATPTP